MNIHSPFASPFLQQPLLKKSVHFGTTDGWDQFADPVSGEEKYFASLSFVGRNPALTRVLNEVILERFPNGVPIHYYASSDGSDPYTVAMKLIGSVGKEKALKYPIIASDINEKLVRQAQAGIISIREMDYIRYQALKIRKFYLDDFFSRYEGPRPELQAQSFNNNYVGLTQELSTPSDFLKKMVRFKTADLRLDAKANQAKQLFKEPVVLCFQNVWYQLPEQSNELARDLFQNLPSKSLLVIGDTEADPEKKLKYGQDIPALLRQIGFREVPLQDDVTLLDQEILPAHVTSRIFEKP